MSRDDRSIPKPRRGPLHLIDAAGYSLAGLRRLWHETAVRIEVFGAVAGLALLELLEAALPRMLVFGGLCLLLLTVEALNTALEELTNRVSPEWSQEAKHAKDLGSAAVALVSLLPIGYLIYLLG